MFPPDHLLLQWHITERCNLRCSHCYQGADPPADLDWSVLMRLLAQFRELREAIRARRSGRPATFHITITGGEPFVRTDAFALLEEIARERRQWSFAVLTNGTLVDDACAAHLGTLGPSFVQVSMDGSKATHDQIRGAGAYERAVSGIMRLKKHHVPVIISFTATKHNFQEFPDVALLGRQLGVQRVWADRLVPLGNASADDMLGPAETRAFVTLMQREAQANVKQGKRTEIAMHRALQFIGGGGLPYRCAAGDSLITVLADGAVCPCRRMPVVAGNLLSDRLMDVYWESPVLKGLRDREAAPSGCGSCFYVKTCAGGLRCLSAAVHGDPFVADPGCWLASADSDKAGLCLRANEGESG